MKKLLSVLVALTLVATVLAGCAGGGSDTIKFGMLGAQSGEIAIYGIAVRDGAQLAIDEINEAGGINGKQIELVPYDSEGDPTKALNLFNRLVDQDKIDALIGPTFSGESLTVGPVADEKKIPMLTPTATNVDVTKGLEFVQRACYLDPYQGAIVAQFASENLGATKAVIFKNVGNDYAVGLADAFEAAFAGEVVSVEGYTNEDADFKAIITKIAALEPDVIFIPDYSQMTGLIATQIKEAGLEATLLGGDGWDGAQKDYADAVEGHYFANHYVATDEKAVVQDFVKGYEAKYGETPNALAALAYDAAKMMAAAIEEAGTTDGEKVQEVLAGASHDGVTGTIVFDEEGDALNKEIVIIKVVGGELTLETKISK